MTALAYVLAFLKIAGVVAAIAGIWLRPLLVPGIAVAVIGFVADGLFAARIRRKNEIDRFVLDVTKPLITPGTPEEESERLFQDLRRAFESVLASEYGNLERAKDAFRKKVMRAHAQGKL
jgi:hypothetical protein